MSGLSRYNVEVVDSTRYALGEGPYYDPRFKRLSWVDIIGQKVWFIKDGKKECIDVPQPVGAAIPLADSEGFALALKDGIYTYENGKLSLMADLKDVYKDYWRSNDAKADAKGRIWFGASVIDGAEHEAEGNLYLFDNGKIGIKVEGTKIANGMAWSFDKKKFFFSDSFEHAVFVFDYDEESGSINNRRELFHVDENISDGLTIDSEDNLWVAFWGGSRIEKRSGVTGELLEVIPIPAKQVTSCCFGDEDMKTLYVTSAGTGLDGEYDGCLFRFRTDVKGVFPDYCVKI